MAARGYLRTHPSLGSWGWYQARLDPTSSAGNGTELISCYILCLLREKLAAESKKRLTVVFCNSWGVEGRRREGNWNLLGLLKAKRPQSPGIWEESTSRAEFACILFAKGAVDLGAEWWVLGPRPQEARPPGSPQCWPCGMCHSWNRGFCFLKLACKSLYSFQGLGILFYLD